MSSKRSDRLTSEEFDQLLANASREELSALKLELQTDSANIKNQLEKAKAQRFLEGESYDADWFRRANHARRMIGIRMQAIAARFSNMKQEHREVSKTEHEIFLNCFFKVAKGQLEESVFERLVEFTDAIIAARNANGSGELDT